MLNMISFTTLTFISISIIIRIIILTIHWPQLINIIIEIKFRIINSTHILISIILDSKNIIFLLTITSITLNIFIFSSLYISHDQYHLQFYKILILFVLSIILLVFRTNLILLLTAWDGLGLTRFLLVAHYNNHKSIRGRIITLISNRVGDAAIIIALTLFLSQNHLNLNLWQHNNHLLIILLICGAITKRAQTPFTVWLPEAIAAPTPVSSLVHSSTLVTAGLFLLIHFSQSINSSILAPLLLYIGLWTSLIGGIIGIKRKDSKKIVAISTLRQLGFIATTLRIGLQTLTFFHLITHARFKALLFITIGIDIICLSHSQSLTPTNKSQITITYSSAKLISLLSLNAAPFLAGFFSKDAILEFIETREKIEPIIALYLATSLTSIYSLRVWYTRTITNFYNPILSTNYWKPQTPSLLLTFLRIRIGGICYPLIINYQPLPHTKIEHQIPTLIITLGLLILIFINSTHLNPPHINFLTKSIIFIKPPTKLSRSLTLSLGNLLIILTETSLLEGRRALFLPFLSSSLSNWSLSTQKLPLPKILLWSITLCLIFLSIF